MTGDEPQGTMGRVQMAGEARLARCLLPAFLCAHIFIERERSGCEAVSNDRSVAINAFFRMDLKKDQASLTLEELKTGSKLFDCRSFKDVR